MWYYDRNMSTEQTTTTYRIRLTLASKYGKQYERFAYVAKNDGAGTWDGSWFTERELEQVKTWKTLGGAERWLACRSLLTTHMGAVIEEAR